MVESSFATDGLSSIDPINPPEEKVCRICRGEGSAEDPLFYPCKCRGSIKYIHQGCLEEWLERSGRDKSCDICHEKYRFTTVYAEDTPDRAPVNLILRRIFFYFYSFTKYFLTVFGLFFGVGFQVPLFFEFVRRFMIFFVDSKTTHDDFFINLLYGDYKYEGNPYDWLNLFDVIYKTYFKTLVTLVLLILAHLILFLEHDWVSRDPGFKKLINKNIGRNITAHEAMRNNAAAMNRHFRALFEAELEARPDQARNLNLGEDPNPLFGGLHDDSESEEDPDFEPGTEARIDADLSDNESSDSASSSDEFSDHPSEDLSDIGDGELPSAALRARHQRGRRGHIARETRRARRLQIRRDLLPNDNWPEVERNNLNEVPDFANLLNRDQEPEELPPFPFPIRHQGDRAQRDVQIPGLRQFQDIEWPANARNAANIRNGLNQAGIDNDDAAAVLAAALANNNNNNNNDNNDNANNDFNPNNARAGQQNDQAVDAFLDNLPVHIIIVASDILFAVYLVFAYLAPYLVGGLIFHSLASISQFLHSFSVNVLKELKVYPFLIQLFNGLIYAKQFNSEISELLDSYLINPLIDSLSRFHNQDQPLTAGDRLIPLGLFYGLLYFGILKYLSIKAKKHNDSNPLKGIQRKIYILLFDLVCSLKVFLIFSIELIAFPAFSGLLVEFALTPFLHPSAKFIMSQVPVVSEYLLVRIATDWAIGTGYMCLFALFVGMTRRYILRPGVLFFIRSPEDPNARLVHDALVRPLSLQLSRICLSGFVYTLFILIGFGVASYGLRLINSLLIPIDLNGFSLAQYPYVQYVTFAVYSNLDILKKYIRQYWLRAFKSACTQMRLSSFILGNHSPKERGHIVYKSIFSRFKKSVKPDYSSPKLYSEAIQLFQDPENKEEAFFIPDGNLIRAPKNDIISRKYVKRLFIAVTKDDIPLKSKEQLEADFQKFKIDEFDESEDEMTTTNQYEIVYRPPLFGIRIIGLIMMLWVFSVILIGGVGTVANLIGKPAVFLHYLPLHFYQSFKTLDEALNILMNFVYGNPNAEIDVWTFRVNVISLSSGLSLMLYGLKKYDKYLINKHLREEGDEVVVENDDEGTLDKLINKLKTFVPVLAALFLRMTTLTYFIFWNHLIHTYAINRPYNHYFGIDEQNNSIQYNDWDGKTVRFTINSQTILLHLLVFIQNNGYVIRNKLLTNGMIFAGADQQVDIVQSSINIVKYVLKNFASLHLSVVLFKLGLTTWEYLLNGDNYQGYLDVLQNVVFEQILVEQQIYSWPVILIAFLGFKNFKNFSEFLKRVNNEVKEQHYAKGKTLENAQVADDLNELDDKSQESITVN